jgi:hypothetical protein
MKYVKKIGYLLFFSVLSYFLTTGIKLLGAGHTQTVGIKGQGIQINGGSPSIIQVQGNSTFNFSKTPESKPTLEKKCDLSDKINSCFFRANGFEAEAQLSRSKKDIIAKYQKAFELYQEMANIGDSSSILKMATIQSIVFGRPKEAKIILSKYEKYISTNTENLHGFQLIKIHLDLQENPKSDDDLEQLLGEELKRVETNGVNSLPYCLYAKYFKLKNNIRSHVQYKKDCLGDLPPEKYDLLADYYRKLYGVNPTSLLWIN